MHAEGAERGWWLGEGHLVQRVHTEHTCRCSKPARLEAGRAASSSPTMACMRCLGSSKQQVCCQAIHAGVWERWARRILATAVACVAPAGAGVVHGYQLESEPRDRDSVALQQRCLQRGLKVGPYSQNDQNFIVHRGPSDFGHRN